MSNFTIPKNDPIRAEQRKATAQRRVGLGAYCASCGESRPEALIVGSKPMTCAMCKRIMKGMDPLDKHHIAGKANSPITIKIPVNDHRAILSVAQYEWPRKTLENPNGDPLLARAAILRGIADTISYYAYLAQKLLPWIAEILESFSDSFEKNFGARWWASTPFTWFFPKR